jgi:hypothetical protein
VKRTRLFCTILLSVSFLVLLGCGGGGGTGPSRTTDLQFTVKAFASTGSRLDQLNDVQVNGRLAPTPVATVNSYDWSVITNDSGFGSITPLNCASCQSVNNFPITMSVWMGPHYKCSSPPGPPSSQSTTTSAPWTVRGGDVPVYCAGYPMADASPNQVITSSLPSSITLTGENLSTSYGTPRVQWYDEYGYVVADQYASSYSGDGTSLSINTPASASTFYNGTYAILVLPKQPDGTYWSQAGAAVTVSGNPSLTPLSISGSDQSEYACGDEGGCMYLYDNGNLNLTVNGYTASTYYSQDTLPEDLASDLASTLSYSGYFYARAVGGILYVAAKNGANISYSSQCISGWPNPPQSPWHDVSFSGCGYWIQ